MPDRSEQGRPRLFVVRNQAVPNSAGALHPAMELLGLGGADAARFAEPVAMAAVIVGKISPAHRQWIGAGSIDTTGFGDLYAQWSALSKADREFRKAFARFGDEPWPAADSLEKVAETIRKTGWGRLFAVIFGRAKGARTMLERLRLSASPRVAANIITRLAHHVRAVEAFNSNSEAADILGTVWVGMATPFEDIDAGLKLRGFIEAKLLALAGGVRIAAAVIALPPEGLSTLAGYSGAADAYLSALYETAARRGPAARQDE